MRVWPRNIIEGEVASLGYEKPRGEAFQAVLDAYPDASSIWMISDSWAANIVGQWQLVFKRSLFVPVTREHGIVVPIFPRFSHLSNQIIEKLVLHFRDAAIY